jgi:hypothetical protein
VAYYLLQRARTTDRAALLSQDWESYAHFAIAARLQASGYAAAARNGYAAALDRDPRNRGALFNLGVLDLVEESNDFAEERLAAAVDEIERIPGVRPLGMDRLWYRATYNHAVAKWHRYLAGSSPSSEDRFQARQLAESVVRASDATLRELGGADAMWLGGANADLARFLSMVRGAALLLYADTVRPG